MGSRMIAGGAGVLAVVALGGCGHFANKRFSDEHTVTTGVRTVTINGGSGSVTITGSSPDGSVHVKRHIRYRDRLPGATDTMTGDTLKLDTGCGAACWVDYELTTPNAVAVAGHNGSGNIRLTGVATASIDVGSGDIRVRGATGDVSVRTGSGNITLADVAGNVVTKTGSGDVRLTAISGTTAATTSSGNIDGTALRGGNTVTHTGSGDVTLRLAAAQNLDADTGSGNVQITVPGGQSYQLSTSTGSGDQHLNVPSDAAADHRLRVHTGSGDITISGS
ncbi:MAG: hypothetical protein QOE03_799 [Micromonosporaceae bacterium]|nr:hypothetical protein [Micromonosporaceae bacterium]